MLLRPLIILSLVLSLPAMTLHADPILMGTSSLAGNQVDDVDSVNALISAYNLANSASLPLVSFQLDKLEQSKDSSGSELDTADFINGNLATTDFVFYQGISTIDPPPTMSPPVDTTLDIFDASGVEFTTWNPAASPGFDIDNPVLAFEQSSGPEFQYYVSKSAGQFSLWLAMSGLNPVYTDNTANGGTIGPISNSSLAYDPRVNAVSHISFYAVPEPSSGLAVLTIIGMGFVARRRRS